MHCSFCGGLKPIHARGLCGACYTRWRLRGTPERARGARVPSQIVAEEWSVLADPALSIAENVRRLAPRLGMSEAALEQAVTRLRRQRRAA